MPRTPKVKPPSTGRKAVGNGSGSVYREGARSGSTDGRWVAQVKADGKFRRTYHPTEAKARTELRKMLAAVDAGTTISHGNVTVGELLTRWQTKVLPGRDLSVRTIDAYGWACDVLREDIGTTRLRKLTAEHVETAFEQRAARGTSRASLVKIRSVLSMTLDYALRRGMVAQNIASIVEMPAEARRPAKGRSLTITQAQAILGATEHRLHALWTVMLYLGLRPGEATGLAWADIDLERAVVHVRRSLKLERGSLVVDERLKTDRSRRSLDLTTQVVATLRTHRTEQTRARLRAGELWDATNDLVFATALGTPLGPRNLHRSLTLLTERLGIGPAHPYDLRHTAASLMSEAGVPMERIADQFGHDGTRMGLLVYRHATKPTVDAGLVMGGVLG